MAHMAVYQTRAYFTDKFGYLTDNPEIGPLLAKHYWHQGNSVNHNGTIESLTGEGFNVKYLADECNFSPEEAWAIEEQKIKQLSTRERSPVADLNAKISIVDGATELANNDKSNHQMCDEFEHFIVRQYGR